MRIALGLDLYLEEFAVEHDADTFRKWGEGDHWKRRLYEVASDAETEIYWNLTNVEVGPGLLRSSTGYGGGTDWELLQFKGNPNWLERTQWFRDGESVPQPEGLD